MSVLDFGEWTIGMRLLAAVVILLILAVLAAALVVFAMMMVLFSLDAQSAEQLNETTFRRAAWIVGGSLVISVVLPPILILSRVSPTISLIPAGIGFLAAGAVTLGLVVSNLGTS